MSQRNVDDDQELEELHARIHEMWEVLRKQKSVIDRARSLRDCWRGDRSGLAGKLTALSKSVDELEP